MTDEELKNIAREIWPLIDSGECIAWIGSGLSKNSGYPGWREIVNKLCEKMDENPIEINNPTSDQLIEKAEICKIKQIDLFYETLASAYGGPVSVTRLAYEQLLSLPFKAYITTNYDPLLRYTCEFIEGNGTWHYPEKLSIKVIERHMKPKFYIHGLARIYEYPNGKNLILARSDFENAYNHPGAVQAFLVSVFQDYHIFFIGCRLEEGEIQLVLDRVGAIELQNMKEKLDKGITKWEDPERIILYPIETSDDKTDEINERELFERKRIMAERRKRFEELRINVIEYEYEDKDRHWEIEKILRYLCQIHKAESEKMKELGVPKNAKTIF